MQVDDDDTENHCDDTNYDCVFDNNEINIIVMILVRGSHDHHVQDHHTHHRRHNYHDDHNNHDDHHCNLLNIYYHNHDNHDDHHCIVICSSYMIIMIINIIICSVPTMGLEASL